MVVHSPSFPGKLAPSQGTLAWHRREDFRMIHGRLISRLCVVALLDPVQGQPSFHTVDLSTRTDWREGFLIFRITA